MCCVGLCSCGISSLLSPNTESTTTTTTTTARRTVETTKTAKVVENVDGDDEGMDGYTSTTTQTGGTLEYDYSEPDLYDDGIIATMTTKATTYYTLPNGKGPATTTTKKGDKTNSSTTTAKTSATTTKFKADALNSPTSDMNISNKKYTVASDTTYLNLRFGPSKKYSVQLEIPNGASVTVTAETTDADGTAWAYTSYNGTSGWVMKGLLS